MINTDGNIPTDRDRRQNLKMPLFENKPELNDPLYNFMKILRPDNIIFVDNPDFYETELTEK